MNLVWLGEKFSTICFPSLVPLTVERETSKMDFSNEYLDGLHDPQLKEKDVGMGNEALCARSLVPCWG